MAVEIGAARSKQRAGDYLSVKLDDPIALDFRFPAMTKRGITGLWSPRQGGEKPDPPQYPARQRARPKGS
ncbi:MAG TPA: hypothetical protein VKT12_05860, partial [Candidatus Binataceae bacterium]|nr:hypothetical protein [Candidatus Binataceae bacterium]